MKRTKAPRSVITTLSKVNEYQITLIQMITSSSKKIYAIIAGDTPARKNIEVEEDMGRRKPPAYCPAKNPDLIHNLLLCK